MLILLLSILLLLPINVIFIYFLCKLPSGVNIYKIKKMDFLKLFLNNNNQISLYNYLNNINLISLMNRFFSFIVDTHL